MSIAEQALSRALSRRLARSVVIKDADAYQALYGQLQTAMTNTWEVSMREGIANALDRLRDLGPGQFTEADGAAILRVLEASVGAEAIRAAMREPVINLSDALFRVGAEEVGLATGVAIVFQRPDLDALDVLKTGNLFWIGDSWNIRHQRVFAGALEEYFTEGLTREGLAERFARDFAGLAERSQRYWLNLADHTASRTREIGRVTGYERAGITRVQVRARLDDRTTPICRQMNGRVIEVIGSRVMRRDYGSGLFALIDQNLTPLTLARIYAASIEALRKWEPRLRVTRVQAEATPAEMQDGRLSITVEGLYLPEGREITLEGLIL